MTTIAPSDQRTDLGRAFDHLHGLVAAQVFQHMAAAMRGGDMSFSQLNALFFLHRHGAQSIAALAEATHLSHAATSRLVDRLVRGKLVDRCEMPGNRRQKRVEMTSAGVDRLDYLQAATAKAYADLFSAVPDELLKQLSADFLKLQPFLTSHPTPAKRGAPL